MHPRFAWQMEVDDKSRGNLQSAYRISVIDETGKEVWNTGKVKSTESLGIQYAGESLRPSTRYQWHLTVWNQKNEELQEKIDELTKQLEEAAQAEEDSQTAENEVVKNLRTELDRTKEAYEALLEAKSCDTREGNVTFSRAMQTLERLKDYLGPTALEEYQTLGGE